MELDELENPEEWELTHGQGSQEDGYEDYNDDPERAT